MLKSFLVVWNNMKPLKITTKDAIKVYEKGGVKCPFCKHPVLTAEDFDPCEHVAMSFNSYSSSLDEALYVSKKYKHYILALSSYKTKDKDFEDFDADLVSDIFFDHFHARGGKFEAVEEHGMACGPCSNVIVMAFMPLDKN